MGAGAVAWLETPVDFFPDISFNATQITTIWTGASAEEVERLVTTEIEEEIQDIGGIKEIRSVSQASVSWIFIEWDETLEETEYESALNDLRAALDRVTAIPDDAEEPILRELSVAEVYAAMMLPIIDVGGVGETALLEIARDAKHRLERIDGIEKVVIRGEHEREVRVLVDGDALIRHDLTVTNVADRIRQRNQNLPAGSLSGAQGEVQLRATGDYVDLEELLDTVVRDSPGGTPVRISDVARVESGLEKRTLYGRHNGNPALMLSVAKQSDAHLLEVAEAIDRWIVEYREVLPDGVALEKTWDTSNWVRTRMKVLWDNLVIGVVFVAVILWLTLGFRNALLTVVAVPFSFLTAIILFPVLDLTINSMSLVGMLLVSGMLVDDAIIVLENIYRRIEEGEPLRQAVVNGAEEVLWPVVSAVSTTCAAFFPLLLITGTSGEFMSILPKTVIVCLVASLFECLVVLPAHYVDWGSRGQPVGSEGGSILRRVLRRIARVRAAVDEGVVRLRSAYLRALDVVLGNRLPFSVLAVSFLVLATGGACHLPINLFPSEYDNFFVIYEAPTDYSLDQTLEAYKGVEHEFASLMEEHITDYSTFTGMALTAAQDLRMGSNVAISYVMMADTEEYRIAPERAVSRVQEQLNAYRETRPDAIVDLRASAPRNGPPIGKPVARRIEIDDYALAKSIAADVKAYLYTIPGVSNVEDNLLEGPREVRLRLDEDRAAYLGLTFQDLARAFRAANDGIVSSGFRDPMTSDDIDIRVLLDEPYRRTVRDLLRTQVRTPSGELVRLEEVAELEMARGFLSLAHYDGQRTVTVYADVDEDVTTSEAVNLALQARFADLPERYPELNVVYGGEFEATREAMADIARLFPLALLLVYMILAAQFRSYLQPLIVATAIPFGLVGVVTGVALLGYNVSFGMMYAAIGLTGVVVNDSLVMVDFINRARRSGMPLLEAVRRSGAVRLRPILLTTLTTVVALLPMALGLQGGSKSYGPFAASIVFGLIVAMVGTLFIVPLTYTSLALGLDRLGRGGEFGPLRGPPGATPEAPPGV
jgi:HAE1 family hydrophobic/amphiphilic exporter-1